MRNAIVEMRIAAISTIGTLCLFLAPGLCAADDVPSPGPPAASPGGVEVRERIGVRSQFAYLPIWAPTALSVSLALDFDKPVRAELQLVGNPETPSFEALLSAGVPFRLYDGRERGGSTLELELPLQLAFGYIGASWVTDHISWLLLGPTTGLDFTWWVRGSVGVCFGLAGSYLFRIADPESVYPDEGYLHSRWKVGVAEVGLFVGIVSGGGR
jgi:hypothetical protein